jgi:hypothetical protein
MSIFKAVSSQSELPTQEVFNLMIGLRNSNSLALASDLYLIEGLCSVLSLSRQVDGLTQLLAPIVQRLSHSLQTSTSDAQAVNADVDRITCAFSNIELDGSLIIQVFREVFPILQTVLQIYTAENSCEKVCRCYKHVIRNAGSSFLPLLPALLDHVVERFQMVPVSAFIYSVNICVTLFAKPEYGSIELLYSAVWKVSSTFYSHLNTLESFEKKPDLVEEYYYMMTKVLYHCPLPFIDNPGVDTIIQAGIPGCSMTPMLQEVITFGCSCNCIEPSSSRGAERGHAIL